MCVFSDGNMKINLESLLPDPESLAKIFQDLQTEEANGMFMLLGIYPEQVFLEICFLFVSLFYCFTSQVNSFGHYGMVSSSNHTFSWTSLNKQLISSLCAYFRL